ncbi:hypothetical protein [Desertihabitans brevis]|uniref:hypothetical protein n=1 Tax=Desertihabitans brevis TaxID=2268447 RepID=UPI0011BF6722|nr:hypothetical protein [Desertihabitans brevis]
MTPPGRPWWRRLTAIVVGWVWLVVVEPVRDGRVHVRDGPPGLAAITAVAAVGYLVAGMLVLLARPIRDAGALVTEADGLVVLPELSLAPLLLVLVLALILLVTAALHTHWLLRTGAYLLFAVPSLLIGVLAFPGLGLSALLPALLALVGLAVLMLVRRRRRFAWPEVLWVGGLVALGVLVPLVLQQQSIRSIGPDVRALQVNLVFTLVAQVALPAVVIGGAALAELAVRAGAWGVSVVRTETPRRWWVLPASAVVVAAAAWAVWLVLQEPLSVAFSALPLAVGVLALLAMQALRRRGDPVGPEDLVEEWPRLLTPLAVVTVLGGWAASLGPVAEGLGLGRWSPLGDLPTLTFSRLAVAGVGLVLAVAWSGAGERVRPTLLVAFAAVMLNSSGLFAALPVSWSGDRLAAAVALVAVLLLAGFALTRSLTSRRATACVLMAALSACFALRQVLADPISWLLGFSALALTLFGLVWRLLSDATWTRADTPAFPRPARVLLFWGYALLAVTSLAFVALGRQLGGPADVTPFTVLGDHLFGTPVFLAAVLGCLWQCVHRGAAVVPDIAEELAD